MITSAEERRRACFPFLQGGRRPGDPEPIRGRRVLRVQSEDMGVYQGQLKGPRLKVLGEGREWATTYHETFAWEFGKPGFGIFCVVQTVYLRLGAQQRCLYCHSKG